MEILLKIPSEQKDAFIQEIKNALKEELEEVQASNQKESSKVEEYLNRQDTCSFLHCSLATLYNYQKSGRLPSLKIGRKVLFKKSDIIAALQIISTKK
jgi:excisionase family DNA binding protein